MTDLTAFLAARDGRKPRKYREYHIYKVSEETVTSSSDDFKASEQTKSSPGDAVQGFATFSTGTAKLRRNQLLKEKAILDTLKIKTVRIDSSDSDGDIDDWFLMSSRPRAGLPNKTEASHGKNSWNSPSLADRKASSPSLADRKASSGHKANKDDNEYSSDRSPSLTASGGSEAVKRPILRGSGGIYVPPKRGLGEVCPPKKDCQDMAPCCKGGRSSLLGGTVDTGGCGAPASGGSGRANNCSGASCGGQRGSERRTSEKDCSEMVVRFTNSRSTVMNKKVDFREKSGNCASANRGGTESSSGSSGLTDGPNTTTSGSVSHPRNADGDSNNRSLYVFARGGSGAVNRPTLQGSEGIYKPPKRGVGEVCPPKEDCQEITHRSRAGRSSLLGRSMNTSTKSTSGDSACGDSSLASNCPGASVGGPGGSARPTSKMSLVV